MRIEVGFKLRVSIGHVTVRTYVHCNTSARELCKERCKNIKKHIYSVSLCIS